MQQCPQHYLQYSSRSPTISHLLSFNLIWRHLLARSLSQTHPLNRPHANLQHTSTTQPPSTSQRASKPLHHLPETGPDQPNACRMQLGLIGVVPAPVH